MHEPFNITRQTLNLTAIFEDGSQKILVLRQYNPQGKEFQAPSLEFTDGIPIVTVMAMGFPDTYTEGGQMARDFLSFADELQDEPVVIIDLRSNRGGNGTLPAQWLRRLTGENAPSNYVWLFAEPFYRVYERLAASSAETNPVSHQNLDDFMDFMDLEALGEHYCVGNNYPKRIVESEQLLIVLTDRFAGSAAESFVDLTFNLQNTLIIGTNTFGSLRADRFSTWSLPNSGIPFGFGRGLAIWPEGLFEEGIGIAPDIWVHGDALNAALAMLRNEGFGN
jgi:hypothetical protein